MNGKGNSLNEVAVTKDENGCFSAITRQENEYQKLQIVNSQIEIWQFSLNNRKKFENFLNESKFYLPMYISLILNEISYKPMACSCK